MGACSGNESWANDCAPVGRSVGAEQSTSWVHGLVVVGLMVHVQRECSYSWAWRAGWPRTGAARSKIDQVGQTSDA
eukprot:4234489-Alexandrium_andersonii.AAC.1